MSASQHITWLNLIEKNGPFLAVSVLDEAFPQGLEKIQTRSRQRARSAYEEWRDAVDAEDPQLSALHREWVRLVIEELLEYDSSLLKAGDALPSALVYREPLCGVEVRPHLATITGETPRLLISVYDADRDLTTPFTGDAWITASPIDRMIQLCRATGVRLGLVTNGERWSLVSVPKEGSSSVATWFARIWQQETVTLQSFISLLGVRRSFGPTAGTLETLLEKSLNDQNEITTTLGEQVRRAVEVLVQALDKADAAQNRKILAGVTPPQLYEAGLTMMMRLVVLLCAEQRGLLLLGVDTYDQHYAITTLRARLLKEQKDLTDDVQERRHDAWGRITALCRGVFSGIDHDTLRLPPLGGSLFDPDRFPFLEGRAIGTSWRETPAEPLPIDNRTVLTLLNALQVLEHSSGAQFLSYEALDVEQVGHVYEGLLEHTVKRVPELTLGLIGSAKVYNPNIALSELEAKLALGQESLVAFLEEATGRSSATLTKALEKSTDAALEHRVAVACGTSTDLVHRLLPFAHLIREDSAKRLIVYHQGAFTITLGNSRRATGSHYTPKTLTEPIVQHTLEPLVYVGPAEGSPRNEWKLKAPAELLALKICDMAMGSAAFLAQVCRYLGDRVVEAWASAESSGKAVSIEGVVLEPTDGSELLPKDRAERVLIARRLVAGRCLYGVDINPMAVELAKLSLWLVTMMKGRPFNFLDHALKCGDSLLGVSSVQQIENFSLRPGERQVTFATANLFRYVDEASAKRRALEDLPSNDHTQIETKNRLHAEAEAATAKVRAVADCLIAFELRGLDGDAYEDQRTDEAEKVQLLMKRDGDASLKSGAPTFNPQLSTLNLQGRAREQLRGSRTFHWPVEFPEVFARNGFDAFVGNPPYMGGKKISRNMGDVYRAFLQRHVAGERKGSADLCAYFFLRCWILLNPKGYWGIVATSSMAEGDTREVCLDFLQDQQAIIYRAIQSQPWPGSASVTFTPICMAKTFWAGSFHLNEKEVSRINSYLYEGAVTVARPFRLSGNLQIAFQGSVVHGEGFVLTQAEAEELFRKRPKNRDVIIPYLRGEDFNSTPEQTPSTWVINFREWPLEKAATYPECLQILTEKVKPTRDAIVARGKQIHEYDYWKFWDKRLESYDRIAKLSRALFHAFTGKHIAFSFVPNNYVYAAPHVVIGLDGYEHFAVLQSWIHEAWVRRYTSYSLALARYTPTDCFEPFPFPQAIHSLAGVGRIYFEHRRNVMCSRHEGLTDAYNRFHDRGEQSADIARLRALHVEMDQAVAAAYGWSDLDLGHGFHPTKQGERYTLSEPARRTVLDRLLALNHQRYAEEVAAGLHDKAAKKKKASAARHQAPELALEQVEQPPTPIPSRPKSPSPSDEAPVRSSADLDQPELLNAIFTCVARRHATDREELAHQVAEELGFKRLTSNLREIIGGGVNSAIRRGLVTYDAQNIYRVASSYIDLDHEFLVNAIKASIRSGCVYTPDEVLYLAADYLGCKRVKDAFWERLQTALTAASRRGIIIKRGEDIRKSD